MLSNKQWVQVKKPEDIVLDVDVELDWTDNSNVQSVIIRDPKGNSLRIIKGEYSGMRALVPATVEKYRLTGTCCGVDINHVFDTEDEAERTKEEMVRHGENENHFNIAKVKVPA